MKDQDPGQKNPEGEKSTGDTQTQLLHDQVEDQATLEALLMKAGIRPTDLTLTAQIED